MEPSVSFYSFMDVSEGSPKPPKPRVLQGPSGDSDVSSHTQYFTKNPYRKEYEKVTKDEFYANTESMSGSTDSFHCVHGPEGRKYTKKGLLQRYLVKKLDPTTDKKEWRECPPVDETKSKEIIDLLIFLVTDSTVEDQIDRVMQIIHDYHLATKSGYKIRELDKLRIVVDFLIDHVDTNKMLKESFQLLLQNMAKPIRLILSSDIVTYFDNLQAYMTYLGHLLIAVELDDLFDLVYAAVNYQLTTPDATRGKGTVKFHHTVAASSNLYQISGRMIAIASPYKFPFFLKIPLLLAYISFDYSIKMMEENIIENIFYRFNPYYPYKKLPSYEINPAEVNDHRVKLGESSKNLSTVLTLLLVLIKTAKEYLEKNPTVCKRTFLPVPNRYAQRCFAWAYRFECRAQGHKLRSSAVRITMTVIINGLLYLYGDRLEEFNANLMPEVMSMSVLSELPSRNDWIGKIPFNSSQVDVQFKRLLFQLSIAFLKAVPDNRFMVKSRSWLLGLMYLLDPGLYHLRVRWVPSLYNELRKIALQSLVLTLPLLRGNVVQEFGLIRRILWFIEWYTDNPYELPTLYWAVRVLQVATYHRSSENRNLSIEDLINTHGVIIIMKLCVTLLDQKNPPIEKCQVILSICLRVLTSCVQHDKRVTCIVYPELSWPVSVSTLGHRMLDVVVTALENHCIICDRWLISLLNCIWEAVIWNKKYRQQFIQKNGIYKLLDLITMTRAPTQCIILAIICDAVRAGDAVGHLVTWRASIAASQAYPTLVKRGATIATLLASIFRDNCYAAGIKLDDNGVVIDTDFPLMSEGFRDEVNASGFREGKNLKHSVSLAATEMNGTRMSKVFAILYLLSEDLSEKVALVDDAYNLYKNVELSVQDESASENIPSLSGTSVEPSPPVKLTTSSTTCVSEPTCAGTTVEENDTTKSTLTGARKRKGQNLECSEENAPSASSSISQPVRTTPAQDKLKNQISILQMELDVAVRRRDSAGASENRTRDVTKLRQEIDKCKKELRKKELHMKHSQSHRLSIKSKIKLACDKSPDVACLLKGRTAPGRPRLEEQQPELLKTIVDLAMFGASAEERRRSEIVRSCRTLTDLHEKLLEHGFQISKSGTYLRLLPKNYTTLVGKRHVVTVPVKLSRPEADHHKAHPDQHFCVATIRSLETLASILGPNQVFFLSQDDKARVPIGLTAANKQAPLLMHVEYRVSLPDHDWVIASRHKLIPSVYAGCIVKENDMGRAEAITYSGPTYVAIRSGKHSSSTASSHAVDFNKLATLDNFKEIMRNEEGHLKPVVLISSDGGPDENPRYPKVISHAIHHFVKHDLDAIFIFTNVPGRSAFNRVERRMAPLSRELSGLILPHDSYGTHLDGQGRTTDDDLERKNFQKAGEVLAEVWNNMVIDSHNVVADYVEPNQSAESFVPEVPSPQWYSEHVRESQYLLQVALVLCSCYQTAKLSEVSLENHMTIPVLLSEDDDVLGEFLHVARGWGKEMKRQQEAVLERRKKKEKDEENSLYAFLGRVRLNIALDALQEVRRSARLCARATLGASSRLREAVYAHQRRTSLAKKMDVHIIKTFDPQLDDQSMVGQYVKVRSKKTKSSCPSREENDHKNDENV